MSVSKVKIKSSHQNTNPLNGVDHNQDIYVDILVRSEDIESEPNQIAGHRGFHRCRKTNRILKPIDTDDVRGRREYTFYRLIELASRYDDVNQYGDGPTNEHSSLHDSRPKISFSHYDVLRNCSGMSNKNCHCVLSNSVVKKLVKLVPAFYGIAALVRQDDQDDSNNIMKRRIFICLKDLTSHCQTPCIIDIKIGRKTYDGWASPKKITEETRKYAKIDEFGFRILGMKLVRDDDRQTKQCDKSFGKTLLTPDEISMGLSEYLSPYEHQIPVRDAIIEKICDRLKEIEEWFLNDNKGQLQFISSSILIVYDSSGPNPVDSVRVSMIDFAHVFHNHIDCNDTAIDENYLFGLLKLKTFFLNLKYQLQL